MLFEKNDSIDQWMYKYIFVLNIAEIDLQTRTHIYTHKIVCTDIYNQND